MAWSGKRARAELGLVVVGVSAGGTTNGCTRKGVRDAMVDASIPAPVHDSGCNMCMALHRALSTI